MSPAELATLRGTSYYHVASELLRQNKCLRTAIWAWKTEAARRGPADRALVCFELRMACERLGDPDVVREQLIPWAEEALPMPGSESQWGRALPALLWAYEYVGNPVKALERGGYWLQQARERNVSARSVSSAQLRLASALADTAEYAQAADVLREAIDAGPAWVAERAQLQLLKVAETHSDIGDVAILPARFLTVQPEQISARLSCGQQATFSVGLRGNSTFRPLHVACEEQSVAATIGQRHFDEKGSVHELRVAIGALHSAGEFRAELVVDTNAADSEPIRIPIALEVTNPVSVEPKELFFGFVNARETGATDMLLRSSMPFQVTNVEADRPALITTEWTPRNRNECLITVELKAPNEPGVLEGIITVETDLNIEPTVSVRYYVHIRDAL
jgi:hypothetical protein